MYKLSVEFSTLPELASFVSKMGGDVIKAEVEVKPEDKVVEEKPKRSRSSKKTEEVEVVAETPSVGPVATPAITQPSHKPDVTVVQQEEPKASTPVIDRHAHNQTCIALINQMKNSGQHESVIQQLVLDTFAVVGCPAGSKITTISDEHMVKFLPALSAKVSALTQAPANFI